MINASNFGVATGRLARDPKILVNDNGSRKVLMTLMVRRNFKQNGEYLSDAISLEAYLPETFKAPVYDMIHKGDQISVMYTVRSSNYEKNGETIYTEVKQIETIQLLESKAVTEARRAGHTPEAAPVVVPEVDLDAVQMPAIA